MARHGLRHELDRGGWDVLELERDATAALRETRQCGGVAPVGGDMRIGNRRGAGTGGRIKRTYLVTEAAGGDG